MDKKLNFGDIVLLKFPFTDTRTFKRRPALLIYDSEDSDIVVCRITSKIYSTANDIYINDWVSFGLKLPSVIRVHKLATLEKNMVETVMGKIDEKTKIAVQTLFSRLIDL